MRKIVLLVVCFLACFFLTACSAEKVNSVSKYEEYLKKYNAKYEIMNGKVVDALKDSNSLYKTEGEGRLSSAFYEGDDEKSIRGLNVTYKDEVITAILLGVEGEMIKELDKKVILEEFPSLDEFQMSLFGIKLNGEVKFFLEINGSASLLADGRYYSIRPLSIVDDKIILQDEVKLEASSLMEDEVSVYKKKVETLGLKINGIENSVFSQNKKAVKMLEIKRVHTDDSNSSKDHYKYGENRFKDLFSDSYTMKTENVKVTFRENNIKEVAFSNDLLGNYSLDVGGNNLAFELNENNGKYGYILLFYPNGSMHAAEELWGDWDTSKSGFKLSDERGSSFAEYEVSNVRYLENGVSFDIKVIRLLDEANKAYVIPAGNYVFVK